MNAKPETYVNDVRLSKLTDSKPNAGPRAWGLLHVLALDGNLTPSIIRAFTKRIGCPMCKESFQQVIAKNPYPERDMGPASMFEWTVKVHNIVNEKLGKPIVPLGKALNTWTCPIDTSGSGGVCALPAAGKSCNCKG